MKRYASDQMLSHIANHPNPCYSPSFSTYFSPSVVGGAKQSHNVFLMYFPAVRDWLLRLDSMAHMAHLPDDVLPVVCVEQQVWESCWVSNSCLQISSGTNQEILGIWISGLKSRVSGRKTAPMKSFFWLGSISNISHSWWVVSTELTQQLLPQWGH